MPDSSPAAFRSPSGLLALVRAASFAAGVSIPVAMTATGRWAIVAAVALLALLHRRLIGRGAITTHAILPFLLGLGCVLLHQWCDRTPVLLNEWRSSGFEAHHTPVALEGLVRASSTTKRRRAVLIVRLLDYRLPGGCRMRLPATWPIHLKLSVPLPAAAIAAPWHPGDTIAATARIGPPRQFGNPGAFQYAAYLKARGIDLLGSIKSVRLISLRAAPHASIADRLPAIRREMVRRLQVADGDGDGSTPAFLTALLVGERDRLDPELMTSLQRAGIYHIVALSGLHVGLLVLLLGGLLRITPLTPFMRRGVMIVAIALYAGLVRDSGSIARATLMAALYLEAGMMRRRMSPVGAIGVGAVLLLAARPAWIEDAGFHLTFAATLGVVASVSRGRDRPPKGPSLLGQVRRQLTASLRISAGVLLATAPLTASHFHIVVPAALVMNLCAVPLSALMLLLAIVISLVQPFCTTIAHLLSRFSTILLELLVWLAEGMVTLPGAWFHVLPPGPVLVLALGFAGLLLAAGDRRLRNLGLAVILVLSIRLVTIGRTARPAPGELEVTLLDVGQGDSILLRLPTGLSTLIDTGGFPGSTFDVGARVVGPTLRSLGILRLDLLILTHAHTDHLGGARAVVRDFAPRAIWLGAVPADDPAVQQLLELAEEMGIPVLFPRRGVRLTFGGTRVEILNPGGSDPRERDAANRGSLALRIGLRQRRALLTGDMERESEGELLRSGYDLQADLLKVGHHGSRTSTSPAFLRAVAPEIALISVGSGNPWGHPHDDVVERLLAAGISVHRSDRAGAVRFRTDGRAPWHSAAFSSRKKEFLTRVRRPAE